MTRAEERRQVARKYIKTPTVPGGNEMFAYGDFIAGAEWADEHPRKGLVDIDKACEYIKEYAPIDHDCDGFIEDFRKAMEDWI